MAENLNDVLESLSNMSMDNKTFREKYKQYGKDYEKLWQLLQQKKQETDEKNIMVLDSIIKDLYEKVMRQSRSIAIRLSK